MSKEKSFKLVCPVCHFKEEPDREYCGNCGYVFSEDPRSYIYLNRPYLGSALFKSILCCSPLGALVLMYAPKFASLMFPVPDSYNYYSALAGYKDPNLGARWLCALLFVASGLLITYLIANKILTPMFEEKKMEKISPSIEPICSHNKKVLEEYNKDKSNQ